MRVVAAAFGIITSLVACDVPPDLIPEDGPVVLGAAPADGEGDADRAGPFRVFFDRRLFPRDVNRGRVSLESGTRGSFLALRFDPVDRVLLVSPQAQLDPATRYRLTLEGLRDLEGRAMASRTVITFETGEDAVGEPPPEAPTWADVAPLFAGCASEGCHVGPAPALGLDLSSGEAVARTAIGETSRLSTKRRDHAAERAESPCTPTCVGTSIEKYEALGSYAKSGTMSFHGFQSLDGRSTK